jgi:hypothetical protein
MVREYFLQLAAGTDRMTRTVLDPPYAVSLKLSRSAGVRGQMIFGAWFGEADIWMR